MTNSQNSVIIVQGTICRTPLNLIAFAVVPPAFEVCKQLQQLTSASHQSTTPTLHFATTAEREGHAPVEMHKQGQHSHQGKCSSLLHGTTHGQARNSWQRPNSTKPGDCKPAAAYNSHTGVQHQTQSALVLTQLPLHAPPLRPTHLPQLPGQPHLARLGRSSAQHPG
jgi:hypothetical protein